MPQNFFNLFRLNLKDKYSWGGGRKRMVGKKKPQLGLCKNQYIYSCILNNQVSHKGRIDETCANKIITIPITVLVHIGNYQI